MVSVANEIQTDRVVFAVGVRVPIGTGQEITDELVRVCATPAGVAAAMDAIARSIWEQIKAGDTAPVSVSVHVVDAGEVRG